MKESHEIKTAIDLVAGIPGSISGITACLYYARRYADAVTQLKTSDSNG